MEQHGDQTPDDVREFRFDGRHWLPSHHQPVRLLFEAFENFDFVAH
jgi:hypothetical protein